MRVLIADDHPLYRAALRLALSEAVPQAQIVEAHDVESLRAAASEPPEPDLVLLDLLMPGARSLAPLAWLRNQFPGTAVMIVSANEDPEVIRRAQEFGAAGYVVKSASTAELIHAIRAVADCGQWFPPGIAAMARRSEGSRATLATRLNSLTPQQYRVLELVARGRLNKQIAAELSIEETTVKAHVSAALAKLGVRNRTQASIVFRELEI
ncbi:MAG: response regulator transcription factor [Steroidobacteraceae bacterium]|nr:response regulator transcription factor [Steroidobacteraceae bacterium]